MLGRADKNVDPLADSATYAPAARMRKVVPVAMPRGTISFWCGPVYSSRGGQFLGSAEVLHVLRPGRERGENIDGTEPRVSVVIGGLVAVETRCFRPTIGTPKGNSPLPTSKHSRPPFWRVFSSLSSLPRFSLNRSFADAAILRGGSVTEQMSWVGADAVILFQAKA